MDEKVYKHLCTSSRKELLDLAKSKKLRGYSNCTKSQLISLLTKIISNPSRYKPKNGQKRIHVLDVLKFEDLPESQKSSAKVAKNKKKAAAKKKKTIAQKKAAATSSNTKFVWASSEIPQPRFGDVKKKKTITQKKAAATSSNTKFVWASSEIPQPRFGDV